LFCVQRAGVEACATEPPPPRRPRGGMARRARADHV